MRTNRRARGQLAAGMTEGMTRFVPTKVHGLIDLTTPPVLLAVPALLRLESSSVAALAPRLAGVGALAYSLVTDYETARAGGCRCPSTSRSTP